MSKNVNLLKLIFSNKSNWNVLLMLYLALLVPIKSIFYGIGNGLMMMMMMMMIIIIIIIIIITIIILNLKFEESTNVDFTLSTDY